MMLNSLFRWALIFLLLPLSLFGASLIDLVLSTNENTQSVKVDLQDGGVLVNLKTDISQGTQDRQKFYKNKESYYMTKKENEDLVSYFSDLGTVKLMSAMIIKLEVGPFVAELNAMPYLGHGLLQPSVEWIRKRNHDTSFGWFGFIYGTLADTIELANTEVNDTGKSFFETHISDINSVRDFLVNQGYNVPQSQVISFYTFYMTKINIMLSSPVSKRKLSGDEEKTLLSYARAVSLSEIPSDKLILIARFYKIYNGALDKNKLERLVNSVQSLVGATEEAW